MNQSNQQGAWLLCVCGTRLVNTTFWLYRQGNLKIWSIPICQAHAKNSLDMPLNSIAFSRRSIPLCDQGYVVKDEWWAIARLVMGTIFLDIFFLNRAR